MNSVYKDANSLDVGEMPPFLAAPGLVGPEAITAGASVFNSLLQSLGQLLSIFKTDITVNGVDVSLANEVIVDEVASELRPNISTIRPTLYFPDVLKSSILVNNRVIKDMRESYSLKAGALANISSLQNEVDLLKAALLDKAIANDKDKVRAIAEAKTKRQAKIAALKEANAELDLLMGTYVSTVNSPAPTETAKATPSDTNPTNPSSTPENPPNTNPPEATSNSNTNSNRRNANNNAVGSHPTSQNTPDRTNQTLDAPNSNVNNETAQT